MGMVHVHVYVHVQPGDLKDVGRRVQRWLGEWEEVRRQPAKEQFLLPVKAPTRRKRKVSPFADEQDVRSVI